MNADFNYDLYQLAVAIYQYAERVVMFPNDRENIQYSKDQCQRALQACRDGSIDWLPVYETYKGTSAKRRGTASVTVKLPGDNNRYGWSHPKQDAERIYNNLHVMWTAYAHNEDLSAVLSISS